MLRIGVRSLSSSSARCAAPARGKAQGFAKKVISGKTSAKKVGAGSLYKPWQQTVATGKLGKNAVPTELEIFKPLDVSQNFDQVVAYSNAQYKSLYTQGSFKQNQLNELFSRPISLVRRSTTKRLFDELKNSAKTSKKYVLTGESGVGKSVLLSQVHALACEEKSILINISYPELFMNGTSDFFHDGSSYVQPMYLKQLLTKTLKANDHAILSSIVLTNTYKFANADPKDAASRKFVQINAGKDTLLDLLSIKTTPRNRGELFRAMITELSKQSKTPVYFTVDNFSRILSEPLTSYKSTQNENIHVSELQLGKTIMEVVSGKTTFANASSCVILATCGSDKTNKTLPVGLKKLPHDPYVSKKHYDHELANVLIKGDIKEFPVEKLSKDEVRHLIDFYLKSEILLSKDTDNKNIEQLVDEKYFLSGNGNPKELLKSIALQFS
ncbi:LANO_0E03840g1_1 [Lachancea nothofagi CBS 11611]|uniref:Small ribosomal subunit protein mS29 n=1 Tax=Lachancea nothofagi CBS 11611 TaxID=1266666 RepID=A0A1G4JRR2_9SACH|nr:LANO_0E03840g1_1 [Lachancea nothofagi CBS 11611]